MKEILTKSADFDNIQQDKPISDDEVIQKAIIVEKFEDYAKTEKIPWRQRSRTLWIKQGVKKTKFFQTIANEHKGSTMLINWWKKEMN